MREEYTRNCFAEILVVCRCCVAIPYMALQRSQWTFLSCLFTSWLQIVKTKGRQQTTGEGHWTFAPLFAPELITDIGAAYLPTCTRKTVRTWIRCVCIHDVISNPTTLGSCKSAFELLAKAGGGLEWRAGQSAFFHAFLPESCQCFSVFTSHEIAAPHTALMPTTFFVPKRMRGL